MEPAVQDRCLFIVFGAMGALARGKLLPALHRLASRGQLAEGTTVLGVDLADLDDAAWRDRVRSEHGITTGKLHYQPLHPHRPESWADLRTRIEAIEVSHHLTGNRVLYLALPPTAVRPTISALGAHDLARSPGWVRLAIEKPFGTDQASARALDGVIGRWFRPADVFRMDHYLGKETVQNLVLFRAANTLVQRVWDHRAIEAVQITVAEPDGVVGRTHLYDTMGVVRDVVQNHALQLLALVAMEMPTSLGAGSLHRAKIDVLSKVAPPSEDDFVLGQYTEGGIAHERVPAYVDEPGIPHDSRVATFAAVRLRVETPRWTGVPFFIRAGKRLPKKLTQVALRFRAVDDVAPLGDLPIGHTILLLTLQPEEGFSLHFELKSPGGGGTRRVPMQFQYADLFGELPDAYPTLLAELIRGEALSSVHADEVDESWRIVAPMLDPPVSPQPYRAGSWGPAGAAGLALPETRLWQEDYTRPGVASRAPRLTDRYERVALIGYGGMAEVYEARDHLLNRTVAIKVLRPREHLDPDEMLLRFRREIDVLSSLIHPNIVKIYDHGQTLDRRVFIAMEYAPGLTLRDLLEEGAVPLQEALGWLVQVCDALDYAHKRGVIHRDLKPKNLLIAREDPDTPVKVVDFGLAKAIDASASSDITQTGMVLGSLAYMAPEQLRGESVDGRCDAYAVGVLLFELATGQLPDLVATNGLPRFPPELRVPPRLEAIVHKCLHPDRAQRYQSMERLRRHLHICARVPPGRYVPAGAPHPAPRVPRAQAAYRRLAIALTMAWLVAAVILAAWLLA